LDTALTVPRPEDRGQRGKRDDTMSTQPRGQDVRLSPALPATEPRWLTAGRIPSLDGLRALAIILVVISHFRLPIDDLVAFRAVKGRSAFLGVQLFFILSGFLITTLMLREIRSTGRLDLRMFYLRRVLRIVPAYAAYLLALVGLQLAGLLHLKAL